MKLFVLGQRGTFSNSYPRKYKHNAIMKSFNKTELFQMATGQSPAGKKKQTNEGIMPVSSVHAKPKDLS